MADSIPAVATPGSGQTINLKILSPAQELAGGLDFPDILLSTSVGELKLRIQSLTPSHPPIQRLRVIFRGQYCRDEETLAQVFSRSPQEEPSRVLHVVISDPVVARAHQAASVPVPGRGAASSHAIPHNGSRGPTPGQTMPGRGSLNQHPSGPNTPGQVPGLPVNPAELFNNLLNQTILGAHLPGGALPRGSHPGFPMQMGQIGPIGQMGIVPPAGPAGAASFPVHGQQSPIPSNGNAHEQMMHEQMMRHQAQINQMQQMQNMQYQQHTRNALGPQNMPARASGQSPMTPTVAPTQASEIPDESAHSSNAPQNPPAENVTRESIDPSTLTQPQGNDVPSSNTGPPTHSIHTTTGIGPDGQRFTVTVQNAVIGYRQVLPGSGHSQPILHAGNVHTSAPGQVPIANVSNAQSLPHFNHTHPGHYGQGLPPNIQFMPSHGASGLHTPVPSSAAGSHSQRPASQTSTSSEDQGRQTTDTMVLLSAQLFNISRSIQALGGRIASSQAALGSSQGSGMSNGALHQSIHYLQAIDYTEIQLRAFDYSCSQLVAMNADILTNPQYLQTQERRRGAGAALARIYEMVRNDVMRPIITQSLAIPTPIRTPTSNVNPTSVTSNEQNPMIPTPTEQIATNSLPLESAAPFIGATSSTVHNPPIPATLPEPQIFILNDPNGSPYALLVGPNGQQTTGPLPWDLLQPLLPQQIPHAVSRALLTARNRSYAHTVNTYRNIEVANLHGMLAAATRRRMHPPGAESRVHAQNNNTAERNDEAPAAAHGAGNVAQPAQAREPDEMRDMLAPIIRNLWLLARVAGFTYLVFGSGRALWRPVMLAVGLTIIWAIQAGLFGDRLDGLRRYLDRLVGVEPTRPEAAAQDNNNDGADGAAVIAQEGDVDGRVNAPAGIQARQPDPEAMAQRLMAQRQQNEATWLMHQVRYIERMFGLFLASLWPGIGEQAVRLQEEREQRVREVEEAARAAEAARQQAIAEAEAVAVTETENTNQNSGETIELMNKQSSATVVDPESSREAQASGVSLSADDGAADTSFSRVNKGKGRATDDTVGDA